MLRVHCGSLETTMRPSHLICDDPTQPGTIALQREIHDPSAAVHRSSGGPAGCRDAWPSRSASRDGSRPPAIPDQAQSAARSGPIRALRPVSGRRPTRHPSTRRCRSRRVPIGCPWLRVPATDRTSRDGFPRTPDKRSSCAGAIGGCRRIATRATSAMASPSTASDQRSTSRSTLRELLRTKNCSLEVIKPVCNSRRASSPASPWSMNGSGSLNTRGSSEGSTASLPPPDHSGISSPQAARTAAVPPASKRVRNRRRLRPQLLAKRQSGSPSPRVAP